mgnify:CR=1 FL=1
MGCSSSIPFSVMNEIREIEHLSYQNDKSNLDNMNIKTNINNNTYNSSIENDINKNKESKVGISKYYNLSQNEIYRLISIS